MAQYSFEEGSVNKILLGNIETVPDIYKPNILKAFGLNSEFSEDKCETLSDDSQSILTEYSQVRSYCEAGYEEFDNKRTALDSDHKYYTSVLLTGTKSNRKEYGEALEMQKKCNQTIDRVRELINYLNEPIFQEPLPKLSLKYELQNSIKQSSLIAQEAYAMKLNSINS